MIFYANQSHHDGASQPPLLARINGQQAAFRCLLLRGSLLLFMLVISGCGREDRLATEYGKVTGNEGSTSVNGTGILFGMFRDQGFVVKREQRISPKLKKFNTIVWIPNNDQLPSTKAVNALEDWLRDSRGRTLIYVGRDFDAELDYLQHMADQNAIENRDEIFRQLAEVKLQQDQRRATYSKTEQTEACRWFEQRHLSRRTATILSGPFADRIDTGQANVELSTILVPTKTLLNHEGMAIDKLLVTDDVDFVYSFSEGNDSGDDYFADRESRIIIVTNGSFLLNYGLVNRENRKLAAALIEDCDSGGDVVFLESGPSGVSVTDKISTNRNAWAWIAEPPLRYIVPHFLLWGVLFCFVFYPIFGRPRRNKSPSTAAFHDPSSSRSNMRPSTQPASSMNTFRSHIVAMGKLLQRTAQPDIAINKIRRYQEAHGKDSNLNQDRK